MENNLSCYGIINTCQKNSQSTNRKFSQKPPPSWGGFLGLTAELLSVASMPGILENWAAVLENLALVALWTGFPTSSTNSSVRSIGAGAGRISGLRRGRILPGWPALQNAVKYSFAPACSTLAQQCRQEIRCLPLRASVNNLFRLTTPPERVLLLIRSGLIPPDRLPDYQGH